VFISSQYITLQLGKRHDAAFIRAASSVAMSFTNPAWDGWVFQMDFFMQLRKARDNSKPLTVYCDNKEEEWVTQREVEFYEPKDLQGKLTKSKGKPEVYHNKHRVQPNDWLISTKWNQGCYDAAQLLENSLRVVQITRDKTHSLKLRYVRKLIEVLVSLGFTINTVHIFVVVPRGEENNFHITDSKIEGHLKEYQWQRKTFESLWNYTYQELLEHARKCVLICRVVT